MSKRESRSSDLPAVEVVCFGMIIPAVVLVVNKLPEHNTGELVRRAGETIEDDAAIVAQQLRFWEARSALIGTALGDDARGRWVVRELKRMGIQGKVRLSRRMATPYEVDVSDLSGARTYFWQRDPQVLDTLDTADLSLLHGARMLYVDWYDGDHILRAMDEARRLGVPVFLNLEFGHQDADILDRYARRATIVQAVTDAAQAAGDPLAVARKLLGVGVDTAIVTLAAEGSIVATAGEVLRAHAPKVEVIDGCGAGATFSAGFIYGRLRGWDLDRTVRFATAAASIKCTLIGMRVRPEKDVQQLADTVRIDHLGRLS